MDKSKFYGLIRDTLFKGKLSQSQVEGLELILAEADKRKVNNEYLAYILATTYHETAHTMQPIAEYGKGKGRAYGKPHPVTGKTYYGRGYVQLTWYDNYLKATGKLGVDFTLNPDLVMVPQYAVVILFDGMLDGWFTGKALKDYLDGAYEADKEDLREFSNARRIINGTDKQVMIGQYAVYFRNALRASLRPETGNPLVAPEKTEDAAPRAPEATQKASGGLVGLLWDIFMVWWGSRR